MQVNRINTGFCFQDACLIYAIYKELIIQPVIGIWRSKKYCNNCITLIITYVNNGYLKYNSCIHNLWEK